MDKPEDFKFDDVGSRGNIPASALYGEVEPVNPVKSVFIYEASKGNRLMRYFHSVTSTEKLPGNLWWNYTLGVWEEYRLHPKHGYSSHAPCKTFRAYKRMLRKNPELVGRSVLVNRYGGYDIYSEVV